MRLVAGLVIGLVLAAPAKAHRTMPAQPGQTPPAADTPDSVRVGAWVVRSAPGEPGGAALSVGRSLGGVELGVDGEVRFPDETVVGEGSSFDLGLRGDWRRFFARADHERRPSSLDDRAVGGVGFGLGGAHGEVYGGWLERDWDDPARAREAGPLIGLSLGFQAWTATALSLRAEGSASGPTLAVSAERDGPDEQRVGLDLTLAEDPAQPHRLGVRLRWNDGGAMEAGLEGGWERDEGAIVGLWGTLRF
ncbi:MAG: outer membrane beta-barrel protein [Alphaproteobacteria bacterium]|nr:outer membrane beta-barrel protein [Alphaproteobacteria bacterium]